MPFRSGKQCGLREMTLSVIRHPFFIVLISEPMRYYATIMLTSSSARLVLGNLAAWSHGSAIVYPSEVYCPRAIVDAVLKERCTALHGVPAHFLGVLNEVQRRKQAGEELDFSRLRFISSGWAEWLSLIRMSTGQELPPVRPSQ